jgi:hypothetical protein
LVKVDREAENKNPKSTRAPKPKTRKKAQRSANVAQSAPRLGDQEPEEGFNMTVLSS